MRTIRSSGSIARLIGGLGPMILLAPEDGGGSAAGAEAGGGAQTPGAAAEAAAAAKGEGQGGQPAAYRPEGLPDHLFGANDKETIDKVFGAVRGFQAEASKRIVPADPNGYKLAPSESVKSFVSKADDPVLKSFLGVAHKIGLTETQVNGFLNEFIGGGIESKLLSSPEALADAEKAEIAGHVEAVRQALNIPQGKDGAAALSQHFDEMEGFAGGLAKQWGLPEGQAVLLASLNDTADGSLFLMKLRSELGERGLQIEGRPAGSGDMTKAEWEKLGGDPRIDPTSPKYDRDLQDRWDKASRKLFG